jgi:antitoxin component YwqK of YwqJK toxin-antitoxin module
MRARLNFIPVAFAAVMTAWLLGSNQTMSAGLASGRKSAIGHQSAEFQDNSNKCSVIGLKASSVENTRAKLSYQFKGLQVVEFGICYNTSGKPTASSSKVVDYQDEPKDVPEYISSKSSIRGLTQDTKYFVKAYVKSSNGEVFYSDEVEFSTPKEIDFAAMLNGPKTEYYPNGKVAKKYQLKDGQIDGLYEFFSDSGFIVSSQEMKNGVANGAFKAFFKNGKTQSVTNFKDGLPQGESVTYYPDGGTKSRSVCTGDLMKPTCEIQSYYPNGQLQSESKSAEGELVFAIKYDDQGRVTSDEKPGMTISYGYDKDGWQHTSINGEGCQCARCNVQAQ